MARHLEETPDRFMTGCPSREALRIIAGKWALLVIPALKDGPVRNNELLRRIDGISQKVLTECLKELERNGLVIRTDFNANPPHVEYRLSPLGRSLSDALLPLDQWVNANSVALEDARKIFDETRAGR
ncbi:MAG TPA: helix-turn-helix domain-containing protein [Burkholderiales bacterium]|nr:helix-turn-helix domain-containing protein [Burkholderiales bacterium]